MVLDCKLMGLFVDLLKRNKKEIENFLQLKKKIEQDEREKNFIVVQQNSY